MFIGLFSNFLQCLLERLNLLKFFLHRFDGLLHTLLLFPVQFFLLQRFQFDRLQYFINPLQFLLNLPRIFFNGLFLFQSSGIEISK